MLSIHGTRGFYTIIDSGKFFRELRELTERGKQGDRDAAQEAYERMYQFEIPPFDGLTLSDIADMAQAKRIYSTNRLTCWCFTAYRRLGDWVAVAARLFTSQWVVDISVDYTEHRNSGLSGHQDFWNPWAARRCVRKFQASQQHLIDWLNVLDAKINAQPKYDYTQSQVRFIEIHRWYLNPRRFWLDGHKTRERGKRVFKWISPLYKEWYSRSYPDETPNWDD